MSVASKRPRGHAAQAIAEALGSVAAPAVQDAILSSALARSGELAVPDGPELITFVRGALRVAIVDRLGDDTADEVLSMLGPLVQRIATRKSVQPRAMPAVITERPPPSAPRIHLPDEEIASGVVVVRQGKTVRAGEFLPVILVVSVDVEWTRALALSMVGSAVVRRVGELLEMVEAIEDHRADLPVVLFDCAKPSFHLESVATFASELPPGSWLALLGAQPNDERAARDFAGTTLTIARIGRTEPVEVIGRRCLALTH